MHRREPHYTLQALIALRHEGASLDAIVKRAVNRAGAIQPFEWSAIDDISKATTVAEVDTILAEVQANPHYDYPFQPQDRVVCLDNANKPFFRTFGPVYVVDHCYDSASGCGGTTFVKIEGHDGGYSPQSFMLSDEYEAICAAREGDGALEKHERGMWMQARASVDEDLQGAAHFNDETIDRLAAKGVLYNDGETFNILAAPTAGGNLREFPRWLRLNEQHPQVHKAGVGLSMREQVKKAFMHVVNREGALVNDELVEGRLATVDGVFELDIVALSIMRDLGLKEPAHV